MCKGLGVGNTCPIQGLKDVHEVACGEKQRVWEEARKVISPKVVTRK